jgi:uncharacterized protein (DUF2141 family)
VLLLLLQLLLTQPLSAVAAELKVTLEQVATSSGNLLVVVCTPETFLRRACPAQAKLRRSVVKPRSWCAALSRACTRSRRSMTRTTTWTSTAISWAPQEGMGFSNDAPVRFEPPRFEDAAIKIDAGGAVTRLRLRYFD